MNPLRIIIGVLSLILLGLVLWASFALHDVHGGFFTQFDVITTLPWGVAAIADLYFGFVLFSVLVLVVERSWMRAALWALPVFFLGNLWAGLWFVLRLPYLVKMLTRAEPAASSQ